MGPIISHQDISIHNCMVHFMWTRMVHPMDPLKRSSALALSDVDPL